MKRIDATEPLSVPSSDDEIPELAAWLEALRLGGHTGYQLLTPASFAAKPPTIYLDTTIVSFLAGWLSRDTRTARLQSITRDWWKRHSHKHILYVSDVVYEEALRGDLARQREAILSPLTSLHPNEQ